MAEKRLRSLEEEIPYAIADLKLLGLKLVGEDPTIGIVFEEEEKDGGNPSFYVGFWFDNGEKEKRIRFAEPIEIEKLPPYIVDTRDLANTSFSMKELSEHIFAAVIADSGRVSLVREGKSVRLSLAVSDFDCEIKCSLAFFDGFLEAEGDEGRSGTS